jgi:hypothetical protein
MVDVFDRFLIGIDNYLAFTKYNWQKLLSVSSFSMALSVAMDL